MKNQLINNENLSSNIFFAFLLVFINISTQILQTPIITNSIGLEAYGLVSLGNQIINIGSVISISLNSVSNRFISLEIYKKNLKKAKTYFTSSIVANLIISLSLLIPFVYTIINIDLLLQVPSDLIINFKILLILLFLNFVILTLSSTLNVSTFVTNKIHLITKKEIISKIVKLVLLITLFTLINPSIELVGVSTLVSTLYLFYYQILFIKKLTPYFDIKVINFNLKSTFEMARVGFWNMITYIGIYLNNGVDIIISNLFFGPLIMGVLSIEKTVSSLFTLFMGTIATMFNPEFTYFFSKKDFSSLNQSLSKSFSILAFFNIFPLTIFVVYGIELLQIWIPNQNYLNIYNLILVNLILISVSGPINSFYQIFSVTNKIKVNSIATIAFGLLSVFLSLILINLTDLGLFSIVFSSTITGLLRIFLITVPQISKILGYKVSYFLSDLIGIIFNVVISISIGFTIKSFLYSNSVFSLMTSLFMHLLIITIFNYLVLKKGYKIKLNEFILSKLRRNGNVKL